MKIIQPGVARNELRRVMAIAKLKPQRGFIKRMAKGIQPFQG
jgi:hypothetical protein